MMLVLNYYRLPVLVMSERSGVFYLLLELLKGCIMAEYGYVMMVEGNWFYCGVCAVVSIIGASG